MTTSLNEERTLRQLKQTEGQNTLACAHCRSLFTLTLEIGIEEQTQINDVTFVIQIQRPELLSHHGPQ